MQQNLESLVRNAIAQAVSDGVLGAAAADATIELERPRDRSHGDYASTVAMRLAKELGMAPREIAAAIAERLADVAEIEEVEVAGPGFINFRLSSGALRGLVAEILRDGPAAGVREVGAGQKVQVEFVSANPVGPMHVGHGRWAALGDSIARLLEATGHEVEREFYINDAGVQMDVFAKSVAARYLELCGHEVAFEDDWYRGAYIAEIAGEIRVEEGEEWVDADASAREAHFKEKAYSQVLAHLERVLADFGVHFDVWFSERTLHSDGAIADTIETLRAAGHVYNHDGAVWFASTTWGDDKDRVLQKADGSYTYFAADIAYHKDKFDRGFGLVIDLWGADHHGYVARMQAAAAALGHEGGLELIIGQLVNLFRDGEAVRMSKRTGEMVTFEELLEDVGPDATRYFFLRRSTDQPVDFDVSLAKRKSNDNPVYYVQYAHARICSILRKAAGYETDADVALADVVTRLESDGVVPREPDLSALHEAAEFDLIRKLEEYAEVVELATRLRTPHKLTTYAEELAAAFHQFYTVCRVVSEDPALTSARLALCLATHSVLADSLGLLGVSAPERM